MDYVGIFVELLFGYIMLFCLVKILGKTQISQITPFDFISALVLGNLLGDAVYDEETHLGRVAFALAMWGAFVFITEIFTQKWRKARLVLEGKPAILVANGKLNWKEMKKNHLDVDQFQQLLRAKNVFSLQEVKYAVLENDGSVSVMKQENVETPTREDLKIKGKETFLPRLLISDGQVITHNLQESGLNEDWLQKELKRQKVKLSEVCYGEWGGEGPLFIQTYQ